MNLLGRGTGARASPRQMRELYADMVKLEKKVHNQYTQLSALDLNGS